MTTTLIKDRSDDTGSPGPPSSTPELVSRQPRRIDPLREWVLERGVLYVLTGTPIVAIIGGVFYHVLPYPFLLCAVLIAFVVLPIWTTWRRSVSTNPAEPAHHLHKYALCALPAAAMFSVVRIPLHFTNGIIYWHPWYDFGNALTNTPLDQPSTLLVGGLLNLIQGWAMGLGFYILFKQHSLMNALLYIAVWVSSLYSFDFATYSRVGLQSPPLWHAAMAWAHFAMAVTLWFMVRFTRRTWPRLGIGGRATTVAAVAVIILIPTLFAQWRSAYWEAPRQTAIDNTAFARAQLVPAADEPMVMTTGSDARYTFALHLGPRDYKNWFNQQRSLDASAIHVDATLSSGGRVIAWCNASMDSLPSANAVSRPQGFAAVMKSVTGANIPVTCAGPAAEAQRLTAATPVNVAWAASMTLIGGRENQPKQFTGDTVMQVTQR